MSIKEKADRLKSFETEVESAIQERTTALSTLMKPSLVPFVGAMVEYGELLIEESDKSDKGIKEWGLKSWMIFLRKREGPMLGEILARSGGVGTSLEDFDFDRYRWRQSIAKAGGVEKFHEEIQKESEKSEKLYFGVNLWWHGTDYVREISAYTRLSLSGSQLWDKKVALRPDHIYVESGEGYSQGFIFNEEYPIPLEGLDSSKFRTKDGANKAALDAVETAVVTACYRANVWNNSWKLEFDKFCGTPSRPGFPPSVEISEKRFSKAGRV